MRGNLQVGCRAKLTGAVADIRLTSHTWVAIRQTTHPSVDGGLGQGEAGHLGGQEPQEEGAGPVGSHRVRTHLKSVIKT